MRRRATAIPFELQCRAAGLPEPQREFRFHQKRRWRFDYAWPWESLPSRNCFADPLALEVEGGVFIAGRHSRGAGMVKDMEKYNAATLAGWRVLRVTPKQVADGTALALVEQAIRGGV